MRVLLDQTKKRKSKIQKAIFFHIYLFWLLYGAELCETSLKDLYPRSASVADFLRGKKSEIGLTYRNIVSSTGKVCPIDCPTLIYID